MRLRKVNVRTSKFLLVGRCFKYLVEQSLQTGRMNDPHGRKK